jgi:hypothetical protein
MSAPDLDVLRARWGAINRTVDSHLRTDAEALRRVLVGRRAHAFRRQAWALLAALCGVAPVVLALLVFVIAYRHDLLYVGSALPILGLATAELVVVWKLWRGFAHIDLGQPIATVQQQLDRLRALRLTVTRWIVLASVLLWWPAIAILLRGLFGADLLRGLAASVWWINTAVGLAFIVIAQGIIVAIRRRYGDRPGFQHLLDDLAGGGYARARRALRAAGSLEQALDDGDADALRARVAAHRGPPPALVAGLRALRWRLGFAIGASVLAMIGVGAFNATHGGQWQLLGPGILLNLVAVSFLVPNVLHLNLLGTLDYAAEPSRIRSDLNDIAQLRERIASVQLVAAPALLLALVQVLGALLAGADPATRVGAAGVAGASACAIVAILALWRAARRGSATIGGLVDALTFGSASATRRMASTPMK